MAAQTVKAGIYRFFSKAQLDAERLRYVGMVQTSNSQLAGASVNGQSFTFNIQGREMALAEWADALADAYNQLGVYDYGCPSSPTLAARFC